MANLLEVRRRIRTVKNIQQITRAMKMVAAARLRRAQDRVINARPYANQMLSVLGSLAARVEQRVHPLLAEREIKTILLVLVTGDKGLAGAFNTNLIRAAQNYIAEHQGQKICMLAVGRKGRDFYTKRGWSLVGEYANIFSRLEFSHAQEIARVIVDLYTREEVDAVDFIYNESKSILVQRLTEERYLPIKPIKPTEGEVLIDYIYEQPPAEIFKVLLERYIEIEVYRALLESAAAEFAARMTAMDAATNNAGEMIDSLTLHMNRVRQAAITKEIIEIVSGAGAQG
ncbi:MAG: ATP synthase F1 subunit gamma [Terriglobia bacterium]|jgi:F-type H+-transporting ATPase subunit gamma